jgi:two-component system sensor histidine kinase PilS (NtrC family)
MTHTTDNRTGALRRRLLGALGARALTVTLLLGTGILLQSSSPSSLPVAALAPLAIATYAVIGLEAATLRLATAHPGLIEAELVGDVLVVSAVVLVSGGVTSDFAPLYVLPILGASILRSAQGGLRIGGASAVVYVGLVVAQYDGLAPLPAGAPGSPPWVLPPIDVAGYTVGLHVFSFLAVASLSGHLAGRLRRADERLERASHAIADLQAFNQNIIDSLTSGLVTADAECRILTFNRAAALITGHTARLVCGRQAAEVLQLPVAFQAALAALRDTRPTRRLDADYEYVMGDGRRIDVGLSAAPLIGAVDYAGYLFTFQDVTRSRKLERDGRMRQRLAALGEMAAGIAHEIRNPLTSMSGSIQILRRELPLGTEQAQLMDIVLRESERLNETIQSFLAYAKPQRLASSRLDLRGALSDTAALLRNSAECRRAHAIELELPDAEVPYEADEHQIRQIVWNLATNGLRAMPDGGRLGIATRLEAISDDPAGAGEAVAVIAVRDEGVGIPPDELDGIFQPFRGAFSKGTGLGLAIVHRIVSDYDGEIRVTSAPGQGTIVEVRLPGAAVEQPA